MKKKLALFAVAATFAFVAVAQPRVAHAQNNLTTAKYVASHMLVHVVKMADILDKNVNTPDKAVAEITAYFNHKKRVKEFKALAAKAKGMTLSSADKAALKKWMKGRKELKKVETSFKNFAKKNPQALQQLLGVFMKLQKLMPM